MIETKKITPIHHMVQDTVGQVKIPKEEVAEVLTEAAVATTSTAPTGSLQVLGDIPKPTEGKQIVTKIKASDDAFLRKYLNPVIKTEEELALFPSVPDIEIGDSEEETEEDETIRDAKSNLIHALGELEETVSKTGKNIPRPCRRT